MFDPKQSYHPTHKPRLGLQHGSHPLTKLKRVPVLVIGPSIAYIELTRGQFALIDSEDVAFVGRFNWCSQWNTKTQSFYAVRDEKGGAKIGMHRFIADPGEGFLADHANGNTLDNRRANLRRATVSQNAMNGRVRSDSRSGYRGVAKVRDRWSANIKVNGRRKYLGLHSTPQAAYEAYCAAAAELHGEYRRTA